MLGSLWNRFVAAETVLAAAGVFVLTYGLAGYPGSAAKSAIFAALAASFLGSVFGALFVRSIEPTQEPIAPGQRLVPS
jgi:hypothetical protein